MGVSDRVRVADGQTGRIQPKALLLRGAMIASATLAVFIMSADGAAWAATCTHYASPSGSGNGASASSPFKIANFWPLAGPGKTLCLLDGKYTGDQSMITPPQYLAGSANSPITIRALNDGKVSLDGQGVRQPVVLRYNDYFVLEGFNAHNSASTLSIIELVDSHHNVLRRVVGWHAGSAKAIFALTRAKHNLIEDCAGFGVARKILSAAYGGDNTTVRRFWGSWEESSTIGPKMTMTPVYNNIGMLVENSILTWNSPMTSMDQPYGLLAVDRMDSTDRQVFVKIYGSIAYLTESAQGFLPSQQLLITKLDQVELKDVVSYYPPGMHLSKKTFLLANCSTANSGGSPCPTSTLKATNLTSIGGAGPSISSMWVKSNIRSGPDTKTLYPSGQSLFVNSGSYGATICKRYVNGTLTNEPLWPWPMNQRIMDAMASAGKQPVDVTGTIEQMFGLIPSQCRQGSPSPSQVDTEAPAPPTLAIR
ncbi:hypothetical protein [Candidatus Nitrospira bockiana]